MVNSIRCWQNLTMLKTHTNYQITNYILSHIVTLFPSLLYILAKMLNMNIFYATSQITSMHPVFHQTTSSVHISWHTIYHILYSLYIILYYISSVSIDCNEIILMIHFFIFLSRKYSQAAL